MRINFTGAQSTGKTTVLQLLSKKLPEMGVCTEVVRNLSKQLNIPINEVGTVEGQKWIFDRYYEIYQDSDNYISDRCIIDPCAYTRYLTTQWHEKDEALGLLNELQRQLKTIKDEALSSLAKFGYVIYFPIEFPIVSDGTRSMNEEFRHRVDEEIINILTNSRIPYLKVCGTPEQRVNQILKYIGGCWSITTLFE